MSTRTHGTGAVADRLLRTASRRWPRDVSDEMLREWRAELAALRADLSHTAIRSSWQSLTFALSLAVSRPVAGESAGLRAWATRLAGAAGPPSTAAASALLSAAAFAVVHEISYLIGHHVPGGVRVVVAISTVALAAMGLAAAGWLAGRRDRAGRLVVAASTVAAGLVMYVFLLIGNPIAVMPFMGWRDIAPAVVAWTTVTLATVAIAGRVAASGRRTTAWFIAVLGTLVSAELATVFGSLHAASTLGISTRTAASWFPLALLPGGTAVIDRRVVDGALVDGNVVGGVVARSDILLGNASAMVGPLLLCSAFAVAYAMGSTRRAGETITRPATPPTYPRAAEPISGQRTAVIRRFAVASSAIALVAWACVAVLGSNSAATPDISLRISALMVAVAGFVVANRGRRAAIAPAAAAFACLVVADRLGARATELRPGYEFAIAVTLLAVGALVLYGAWHIANRGGHDEGAASDRRVLVAIAVIAAFAMPTLSSTSSGGPIAVGAYAIVALAWLVAVMAAFASRQEPFGPVATMAVVVVPYMIEVAVAQAHARAVLVQAPLAVAALAVARWRRPARWREGAVGAARWAALLGGVTVLGMPVAYALDSSSNVIGVAFERIVDNSSVFGFGFASGAAGHLTLAVACGVMAARWVLPSPAAIDPPAAPA